MSDVVGDYCERDVRKKLFNCPATETAYDYLSRCTDHFNINSNNKDCISMTVNRANERDCELCSHQNIILLLNLMQYLKQASIKCSKKIHHKILLNLVLVAQWHSYMR